ncbi:hypothetical protein B0H14DRAFT_2620324 [Mycena olivaceomarginata]|nr:hypothetical protein B0H14DRAFT_2620324 [Mycena olivaceomarginata]
MKVDNGHHEQAPGSSCKGWSEKVAFSERKFAISLSRRWLFEAEIWPPLSQKVAFRASFEEKILRKCPNWDFAGAVSWQPPEIAPTTAASLHHTYLPLRPKILDFWDFFEKISRDNPCPKSGFSRPNHPGKELPGASMSMCIPAVPGTLAGSRVNPDRDASDKTVSPPNRPGEAKGRIDVRDGEPSAEVPDPLPVTLDDARALSRLDENVTRRKRRRTDSEAASSSPKKLLLRHTPIALNHHVGLQRARPSLPSEAKRRRIVPENKPPSESRLSGGKLSLLDNVANCGLLRSTPPQLPFTGGPHPQSPLPLSI